MSLFYSIFNESINNIFNEAIKQLLLPSFSDRTFHMQSIFSRETIIRYSLTVTNVFFEMSSNDKK